MSKVKLVRADHLTAIESSSRVSAASWDYLDGLESEVIHILREVAAECVGRRIRPSGGVGSGGGRHQLHQERPHC
jgi:hypothetical protein